ncbi:Uncharacterized protein OBRU01_24954, partial [Operophtera brumata]
MYIKMAPHSLAKDMARENWFHQTHYEQMGSLKGAIKIDGREQLVKMPCVRDHSFGKYREWRNFHRYVLHFIFLENGDCMTVGAVVTIGYVCLQDEESFYIGKTREAKFYERWSNVEVNGVKGKACVEWQYNNIQTSN